jgi:hypothetical protein
MRRKNGWRSYRNRRPKITMAVTMMMAMATMMTIKMERNRSGACAAGEVRRDLQR